MKLLVTGGAGFIGTNFLTYMSNKYPDYEFVCLDNLCIEDSVANVKYLGKLHNVRFIKEDITNEKYIDSLFKQEKFDAVINFAAEVSVDHSIENPNIFLHTNILGTATLLDACLKYNVPRYHQLSTDEVYGDVSLTSHKKYSEKATIHPSNPYAASKAGADALVQSYCKTFGLFTTISRCTNNYGPHQSYRALIPIVILNAMHNKKIPVHGTGEDVRDWLFVTDHVKALDCILHHGKKGEIYNISGHSQRQNMYVIKTILNILGKDEKLLTFVQERPGQDHKYSITDRKLRKQFNFKLDYTFERGIKETVNWYLNN